MLSIKNRPYAPVALRITEFRDKYPLAQIITEVINWNPLTIQAKIVADGVVVAQAHAQLPEQEFLGNLGRNIAGRFLEEVETSAVGRALGLFGFNTHSLLKDDDNFLADSPAYVAPPAPTRSSEPYRPTPIPAAKDGDTDLFIVENIAFKQDKLGKPYATVTGAGKMGNAFGKVAAALQKMGVEQGILVERKATVKGDKTYYNVSGIVATYPTEAFLRHYAEQKGLAWPELFNAVKTAAHKPDAATMSAAIASFPTYGQLRDSLDPNDEIPGW